MEMRRRRSGTVVVVRWKGKEEAKLRVSVEVDHGEGSLCGGPLWRRV